MDHSQESRHKAVACTTGGTRSATAFGNPVSTRWRRSSAQPRAPPKPVPAWAWPRARRRFVVAFPRRRIRRQRVEFRGAHARLFLQIRHHRPDRVVVVRQPPRRHRGHPEAVLDDPERLGRVGRETRQVGWRGVQAVAQLGTAHAGREVAARAHFGIALDPILISAGSSSGGGLMSRKAALDRVLADQSDRVPRDGPVRYIRAHLVDAAEGEGKERDDGDDDPENRRIDKPRGDLRDRPTRWRAASSYSSPQSAAARLSHAGCRRSRHPRR